MVMVPRFSRAGAETLVAVSLLSWVNSHSPAQALELVNHVSVARGLSLICLFFVCHPICAEPRDELIFKKSPNNQSSYDSIQLSGHL